MGKICPGGCSDCIIPGNYAAGFPREGIFQPQFQPQFPSWKDEGVIVTQILADMQDRERHRGTCNGYECQANGCAPSACGPLGHHFMRVPTGRRLTDVACTHCGKRAATDGGYLVR